MEDEKCSLYKLTIMSLLYNSGKVRGWKRFGFPSCVWLEGSKSGRMEKIFVWLERKREGWKM